MSIEGRRLDFHLLYFQLTFCENIALRTNFLHKYSFSAHIYKVTAHMNTLPRLFIIYPQVGVDKILRSLNVLNSYVHASVACPNRDKGGSEADGMRFGCATGACAYEFKTLRVSRVLSAQLVAHGTNCLH